MKSAKGAAVILVIVLFVAALMAAYVYSAELMVFVFSRANELDISYSHVRKAAATRLVFDNLEVSQKQSGMGLASDRADITFSLGRVFSGDATITFDLTGVHFIKKSPDAAVRYDNIDGLVAIPFSSSWRYREVSGSVTTSKDGIHIKDLKTDSDDLRLVFTGDLYKNNTLKSDITIYFSGRLIGKVPPELTSLVLRNENEGWKSLSVKLEGDLSAPAVQVTGRLFKLSIGPKE